MIDISGDKMTVTFRAPWTLAEYATFLKTKSLPESRIEYAEDSDTYTLTAHARFAGILGVANARAEAKALDLAAHLFDYQRYIVRLALDVKRFAIWADTGLGKTAMFLEFARHVRHRTNGRVLIFSPLQIIEQTREESRRFYGGDLPIERIESRADLRRWCEHGQPGCAITNYEKMIARDGEAEVVNELRWCSGVILDESSVLKSGGGRIKWALIKSCRGVEYKLSCTATPAPNDTMEYASQGSFLEKLRTESDIIWTYFRRNELGEFEVKPHAREAFFRFMSGWSIYLRNPAAYGWGDNLKDVPKPEIITHKLPATPAQRAAVRQVRNGDGSLGLFGPASLGVTERIKLSQIARGFVYGVGKSAHRIESRKPALVADLVRADAGDGRQVLVWTHFDEESDIIAERLEDMGEAVGSLTGSIPLKDRLPIIEAFRRGDLRVLITRPRMLGYGMNFQFCTSMVFSGFSDSFEDYYQAMRRAYRYGQTKSVRVHVPYVEGCEDSIFENLMAKEAQFLADVAAQERHYISAIGNAVTAAITQ